MKMSAEQLKQVITRAFERLGPERVERGIRLTQGDVGRHTWGRCFIARSYGEPHALERRVRRVLVPAVIITFPVWFIFVVLAREATVRLFRLIDQTERAQLVGLSAQELVVLVSTYDYQEEAFRALAAEWLELNREPHAPQASPTEKPPRGLPVLQTAQAPAEAGRR
jgi:hypothetical protein